MSIPFALLAFLALALLTALILIPVVRVYRGTRLVACPETKRPAAVKLDAMRAAFTPFGDDPGRFRLTSCSRWPEKAGCGQECLSEVERDPGACLVRTIVAGWYRGSVLRLLRQTNPRSEVERAPAGSPFARRGHDLVDGGEAGEAARPLSTHKPVCWDCHVVQSLIREHPDDVTVRPEREHLWS